MRRIRRLAGMAAGLIGLLVAAMVRADEPSKLVPQDAVVYVEVSNASQIVDRLLAPDIVGMLDSVPQFRQLMQSDQFAQLRAVVSYVESKLGTNWRKAIGDLTGGGAVFAIRPGQPDYALFVVRAKDADLLRRTNDLMIELAEQDARDKGHESPVKNKEYKGTMAWSLGKDEYHAIIGDTIVITNKSDGLKTALEMHAGEGPSSIAELDLWQTARRRALPASVAWAFGRLDMLRQAGFAKDFYQEKSPNAAIPILFGGLPHVLGKAQYFTASLALNDEKLALRVEVPRDGAAWPAPLSGVYSARPGEEAAVPLRPARTIATLSFYRDFKAIWDARDQLVTADVLPGFTDLETNVSQILFGGREFAAEVLGEIGPRIRLVAAAQDYSKAKLVPEIKIPAFALVLELKHPEEFGPELFIAYQNILAFVNVNFGQQNQPRLILQNETYKSHPIQAARFLVRPADRSSAEAVHLRHNFSPACSVAGRYFVLGSTIDIVKDVIDSLGDVHAPPKMTADNIIFEADMAAGTNVLAQNREPFVSQNMLSGGNTRQLAEQEFDTLVKVLGLFGKARASWTAEPTSMHVDVSIEFAKPQKAAR